MPRLENPLKRSQQVGLQVRLENQEFKVLLAHGEFKVILVYREL